MKDIRMSEIFIDGEVMVAEWGDRFVLSDDFHLEIGSLCQLGAAAHAINSYDAMQARIEELEKTILEVLDDHGDLADGDACTLIKLKRVMGL